MNYLDGPSDGGRPTGFVSGYFRARGTMGVLAMLLGACVGRVGADAAADAVAERDVADDGVSFDVANPPDGGGAPDVFGTARLFDPCGDTVDCAPSAGSLCIPGVVVVGTVSGYPGGMCSRRCTANSQCQGGTRPGVCSATATGPMLCHPTCMETDECRDGYACRRAFGSVCLPFCTSDAQCGGAAVCDIWYRTCFPAGHRNDGRENGQPCTDHSDCKAYCRPEEEDLGVGLEPTGRLDGACWSHCLLPVSVATLPRRSPVQGHCPDGSVCVNHTHSTRVGDIGWCEPACFTDADCRPGYGCFHDEYIADAGPGAVSFCAPIDCHDRVHDCPPGFHCIDHPYPRPFIDEGMCVRDADAGAPLDASAD